MTITRPALTRDSRTRPARRKVGAVMTDRLTNTAHAASRATRVLLAKNTIERKQPPLEIDLASYESPDFVYQSELGPVAEALVSVTPVDGMRYVHGPRENYFLGERHLALDFDEFVSRVDIAEVGQMYRDVIGITTQVLRRDDQGRIALKLERIAALAQPNYAALMGKKELDVYKLERIEYLPDVHRNWMRDVGSPNGSTICDDGVLSFERSEDGGTTISFLACQQFPIPWLLDVLGVGKVPWMKRVLTERAYELFFDKTVGNIVTAYSGREWRVGRLG